MLMLMLFNFPNKVSFTARGNLGDNFLNNVRSCDTIVRSKQCWPTFPKKLFLWKMATQVQFLEKLYILLLHDLIPDDFFEN